MGELIIIKIGGNIIDDDSRMNIFLQKFSEVKGGKILVHGGGKIASTIGQKLGIEPNYINGRRITDAATLELVTMVYGGLINKSIVSKLQNIGINAVGLTGADGGLIQAKKRTVSDIDYGYAGDIKTNGINCGLLITLLNAGFIPVIAPLSYEQNSGLLNTNADTIANEVAIAMAAMMKVSLIYCFEKKGVLSNATDANSVISKINKNDFEQFKQEGIVSGGMIPKLENAFSAIAAGVNNVIIGQAEDLQSLTEGTNGTQIVA